MVEAQPEDPVSPSSQSKHGGCFAFAPFTIHEYLHNGDLRRTSPRSYNNTGCWAERKKCVSDRHLHSAPGVRQDGPTAAAKLISTSKRTRGVQDPYLLRAACHCIPPPRQIARVRIVCHLARPPACEQQDTHQTTSSTSTPANHTNTLIANCAPANPP
jgi:hypothetical protein